MSENARPISFVYNVGSTVGTDPLSATNPENGTVTLTYDSNHMLVGKTDNKQQQFTYAYDAYKRLQTISVGGTVLRTFYYDTNPLDGSFSSYSQGRLTAVQRAQFSPGSAYTPNQIQFAEMYSYSQPARPAR